MASFPQVLLCILAVVTVFIFILATLICCLLRFVGRPDYVAASSYYNELDASINEKSYLLEPAASLTDSDENYYGYVKPTLIYQTLDPLKKGKRLSTGSYFDVKVKTFWIDSVFRTIYPLNWLTTVRQTG